MATDDRFTKSVTLIKDLRPGLKNVTCVFIVIDKGTTNHTKDGSVVRKCRVADKSASVCFSLWNEQASAIEGGDILKLTRGYASLWKGSMVLYSGKYGKLEKIGEFNMLYSETPDMSSAGLEFAQRGQQQQPPNTPGSGGPGPISDPRGGPPLVPGNGRMGTGPPPASSVSGNWNGNNHLGDRQPHETPPSLVGHMIHEPNHMTNGFPPFPHQKPLVRHYDPPHDNRDGNHRGPPKPPHPYNPNSERYHPYNRPPNHNGDLRSGWR